MVKARHIHESAAMCRTEFVGGMVIGIGTVQEFSRHKVKFSTAAKLTHAR
jgi:energy-converting hydrogenase Eha subunit B